MTIAEKRLDHALQHIQHARDLMLALADATNDDCGAVSLEVAFDDIEEECVEFARCQFGVTRPKNAHVTPR